MMRLEVDSTEFVYIPVEATTEDEDFDVTRIEIEVAFTPGRLGPLDPAAWLPAVWRVVDGTPYARVLVGPRNNGHRLTPGKWWLWVRFHASPEVPVRRSDHLVVSGTRPSPLVFVGGQAALVATPVALTASSAPLTGAATVKETT